MNLYDCHHASAGYLSAPRNTIAPNPRASKKLGDKNTPIQLGDDPSDSPNRFTPKASPWNASSDFATRAPSSVFAFPFDLRVSATSYQRRVMWSRAARYVQHERSSSRQRQQRATMQPHMARHFSGSNRSNKLGVCVACACISRVPDTTLNVTRAHAECSSPHNTYAPRASKIAPTQPSNTVWNTKTPLSSDMVSCESNSCAWLLLLLHRQIEFKCRNNYVLYDVFPLRLGVGSLLYLATAAQCAPGSAACLSVSLPPVTLAFFPHPFSYPCATEPWVKQSPAARS